jgi:hypothetical protein
MIKKTALWLLAATMSTVTHSVPVAPVVPNPAKTERPHDWNGNGLE